MQGKSLSATLLSCLQVFSTAPSTVLIFLKNARDANAISVPENISDPLPKNEPNALPEKKFLALPEKKSKALPEKKEAKHFKPEDEDLSSLFFYLMTEQNFGYKQIQGVFATDN